MVRVVLVVGLVLVATWALAVGCVDRSSPFGRSCQSDAECAEFDGEPSDYRCHPTLNFCVSPSAYPDAGSLDDGGTDGGVALVDATGARRLAWAGADCDWTPSPRVQRHF